MWCRLRGGGAAILLPQKATDAKFWRKNIRYAIVIIVIFGAIITPDGSGVTMWFIGGPMIALYVAGMFFVERKERQIRTLKSQSLLLNIKDV